MENGWHRGFHGLQVWLVALMMSRSSFSASQWSFALCQVCLGGPDRAEILKGKCLWRNLERDLALLKSPCDTFLLYHLLSHWVQSWNDQNSMYLDVNYALQFSLPSVPFCQYFSSLHAVYMGILPFVKAFSGWNDIIKEKLTWMGALIVEHFNDCLIIGI